MKSIRIILFWVIVMLVSVNEGIAQKSGNKYGEDSIACIRHNSLYREFYKQKSYNDALPHWRWVFANCPLISQNIYIDGSKLMGFKINESSDQKTRDAYIDTLMMVFDNRIKYFGDSPTSRQGLVLGRQGMELDTYRPSDTLHIYELLRKSIELEGINSDPAVVSRFYITVLKCIKSKQFAIDSIVDAYDNLSMLVDQKLKLCAGDTLAQSKWMDVRTLLESQFEPFASCDEIEQIYTVKFRNSPNDTVLLKKIIRLFDKKECTNRELLFNATENLHKARPTGQSAYLLGKLSLLKGDLSKAESYLSEAIPNLDDILRAKACYFLAKINFDQKRYSEARSYALKSLAINPGDGKCYLLIGNMYAASASSCGGNDEIAKRAGYWAAVDKFIKARTVDPTMADEANKSIAIYSPYFPTRERLFFNDVKEGSSYAVGCWINETTIVRAAR